VTVLAVVGVDPGGSDTGIVLRAADKLLAFDVVSRRAAAGEVRAELPDGAYLCRVVDTVVRFSALTRGSTIVTIEGIKKPTGFAGGKRAPMNPMGLIATGMTLGAVLAAYPEALVVPPGGNGSLPIPAYPSALRPTSGRGAGADRLRHARSAWDVADLGLRAFVNDAWRAARGGGTDRPDDARVAG
jgi:hypothetical protein